MGGNRFVQEGVTKDLIWCYHRDRTKSHSIFFRFCFDELFVLVVEGAVLRRKIEQSDYEK